MIITKAIITVKCSLTNSYSDKSPKQVSFIVLFLTKKGYWNYDNDKLIYCLLSFSKIGLSNMKFSVKPLKHLIFNFIFVIKPYYLNDLNEKKQHN